MNLDEVNARLAQISEAAADDERAHSMEDELHQAVLRSIADGSCDNPAHCAAAALTSLKLDFARWCA